MKKYVFLKDLDLYEIEKGDVYEVDVSGDVEATFGRGYVNYLPVEYLIFKGYIDETA